MFRVLKFRKAAPEDTADQLKDIDEQKPTPKVQVTTDPIKDVIRQAFENGRSAAIASGAVTQPESRVVAVEEYGKALVRALYKPAFDPSKRLADRKLQEQLDALSERHRLLLNDETRLNARRREAEREVPAPEPPPTVSRGLILFSLAGFAVGFGASLVPLLSQNIEDTQLVWFVALALGAAVGGIVIWSTLVGCIERKDIDEE